MNYNLFRFVEHLDYNEFVAFSAKMLNKFNYKDISYEKKYVNIDGVSYTVSNDGKKYIVSVVQSQVPIDETIIQRMEMRKIYYEADSSIIISSAEFTEEALNLAEIMKSKCYGKHYVESFLSDFNSDCIGFINYLSNEKIIKQDYSPAEIIRMYNELKIGSTKIPQFDSLKFTVPNFSDIFIKFWNNWYDFLFFMNEPSDLVMLNEKNISADQILGIDLTFKPKPKVRKVEVHVPKQEVRAEDSDDFIEEKRNLIKMKPKLPPPPPAPPVMQSIQPVSTKEPTSQQPLTNDTFYVKNKKKNRFSKPEYTAKPGDLVSKPPDPQRIQDRSMSMDINQMPAFASGKQPVKLEKKKLNVSAPSRTGIAAPDINREDKPILAKHEKYKQLHKQAEVEVAKEAPKVTHKVHHVEKAPEIKVAEVKATEVKIAVEKIAEAKVPKEKIAKTRKPKPIKYTNEDLIAAYFVVKENLGRKPTVAQMIQHGSFSFTTYVNRWGSYNKFLVSINEAEPEKIETKEVIKPISKEDKAELILDTVLESKAVKKAEPIIREISAIEPPVKANKQEIIAQKQEIVETLESGTFELQIEMVQEEPAPVVEAPAQLTYEQIVSLRESNEVPDSENHVSVADAIDMIDKIYPIEHSSSGVIVKGLTPITSVPEPISDIYISTPKIAEESFIIRDIDMIVSVPITEINETTAEAAGMQPCENEIIIEVAAEPEQEMQVQEAIIQPEETAIIEMEVVPEVIASPEPEQEMQVQEATAQPEETAIIEIEVVPEVIASPEPEQEMQVQEAIAQPDEIAIIEIEVVPEVIASLEPEQEMQVQEAIAQPDETAIIEIELVP
ncbi:MAG: restriction endonuclease, partial [Candidatus Kapabacteria bacterium]|nr:restriction endonuclease [Candidatus Kapabacteria bacterium]